MKTILMLKFFCCKVSQPFELLGMDLIGKLTETKHGHQYICVMIDYFTKWAQAYPLTSKAAKEVTKCIIKFVHQFEAPKRILTDQGKEFVNAVSISFSPMQKFTMLLRDYIYCFHKYIYYLKQCSLMIAD